MSATGTAETGRALEIAIFGIGPPVDAAPSQNVRKAIGRAVAAGAVDRFIRLGYGIEGSVSGCVEAGRFTPDERFAAFVQRLRAIRPDPSTTSYSVEVVDGCECGDF